MKSCEKSYLKQTIKVLYEASNDLFWGIGLPLSNMHVLNKAKHKGQNKLDEILMSVREQLKANGEFKNTFLNFAPLTTKLARSLWSSTHPNTNLN
jgi:hypothetical protein